MTQTETKAVFKRRWLLILIAAALLLSLLAGIVFSVWRQHHGPVRKTIGTASVNMDQLDDSIPDRPFIDQSNIIGMIDEEAVFHPTKQFGQTMSVHAKIEEILPDTYCLHDTYCRSTKVPYRILRLRVLDTIVGSNMPNQIYYLLPTYLSMDLLEYDSFILTVRQVGLEDYSVINATQQTMEAFTLLFEPWSKDACWGSVLAFSDGVLDPSLWEKAGWNHVKDQVMEWIAPEGPAIYPGKLGRNIRDTKAAILAARQTAEADNWYTWLPRVITSNDLYWKEARQALRYVRSAGANNFLTCELVQGPINFTAYCADFLYIRYINGFPTNEYVSFRTRQYAPSSLWDTLRQGCTLWEVPNRFYPGSVDYSYCQFTQEDLQNLPDLPALVERAKTFDPPKTEQPLQFRLELVTGEYVKYEGYVFAYATCYWRYCDEDGSSHLMPVYYRLFPDGTCDEAGFVGAMDSSAWRDWIEKQ